VSKVATVIASALLAGSAAGAFANTAPARSDITIPKPVCFASAAKLSGDRSTVSGSGWCVINGRRRPARLSYSYDESDPWSFECGKGSAGQGSTFVLQYPKAYSAFVTFTATSVDTVKGRHIRSAPKSTDLTLGNWKMDCQLRGPTDVPPSPSNAKGYVCGYIFKASSGNTCGVVTGLDNQSLPASAPVPYWTDHPAVINGAFHLPPFATPSGLCTEKQGAAAVAWMGNQLRPATWTCGDGTYIIPKWYIYLSPDDPHSGNGFHASPSCKAGDFNLPPGPTNGALPFGGDFSSFTLPKEWAGRVDVELQMLVVRGDGSAGDVLVSSEYADSSNYPNTSGAVNGCPALVAWR
jgi:hypothetical protein